MAVFSQAERALFTKRRKEAYEALHPETKHGAVGRGGKKDPDIGSFIDDTADKTNRSRSSISSDAMRGKNIDPEVLAEIVGTKMDTGKTLDALAAVPRDSQQAKLDELRDAKLAPAFTADTAAKTGRSGAGRPALTETPHDPETGEIKDNNVILDKPHRVVGNSAQAGLRRLEKAASAGDGNAAVAILGLTGMRSPSWGQSAAYVRHRV